MHVILFLLALLFIVAGGFAFLATATATGNPLFIAEMVGNTILLLGFGFVMLGIAGIIERQNRMNLHLEKMSVHIATANRMLATQQNRATD